MCIERERGIFGENQKGGKVFFEESIERQKADLNVLQKERSQKKAIMTTIITHND